MQQYFYGNYKIGDIDLFGKGKIEDFLRERILAFLREEIAGIHEKWAQAVRREFGCQRNGYYERGLICEFGDLGLIKVPRFRCTVNVENPIFAKNSRYAHGFVDKVIELFCRGLSTWSIAEMFDGLISSTTVSRRVGEYLVERLRAFEEKQIERTPMILVVDGIWLKIKGKGKRVLLCAVGIDKDGISEVIHFELYPDESPGSWTDFFEKLIDKGLTPTAVKLVVSDCIRWLKKIVGDIFPHSKWQRCIFHLIMDAGRSIKNHRAKRSFQKMLGWVFKAPSVRAFWERWKKFKNKWQQKQPKAFRIVELGLDDAIVFFQFPRHLWRSIRTTNTIESIFAHIRRRTKWFGTFNNINSARKLITMPVLTITQN